MSSREKILTAIAANKPTLVDLPVMDIQQVTNYGDLVAKFTATLEGIGGKVLHLENSNMLESMISEEIGSGKLVYNAMNDLSGELNISQAAIALEPVHKAFVKAGIGVAENGSVWVNESQMVNRLLPFICQHLVIVLEKEKLVATMHHAYQQINTFEEGFGVFIAGPSKTADIEQSLVIGAHGARSMTVYLLNNYNKIGK
jgi:L-lactate dehydrogenase complex protein LldG